MTPGHRYRTRDEPEQGILTGGDRDSDADHVLQHEHGRYAGEEDQQGLAAARDDTHVRAESDRREKGEHEVRLLRALEGDFEAAKAKHQDHGCGDQAAGHRMRDRVAREERDARGDEPTQDQDQRGKGKGGGSADRVRHRAGSDWEDGLSTA